MKSAAFGVTDGEIEGDADGFEDEGETDGSRVGEDVALVETPARTTIQTIRNLKKIILYL